MIVAPPVLEPTVASTVGEIFKLENYHLVFLTNAEHLKRIHIATVQEPQTIPRVFCLGSCPQAKTAKFCSQLHQNKARTTHVFVRVVFNLYQHAWEQIWAPSLKHDGLEVSVRVLEQCVSRTENALAVQLYCVLLFYGLASCF